MRISRPLTLLFVLMIAVSAAGAARLRAKPPATDASPKSDPALVRQHIIDLLTALPDLVPANAAYAARMANLKARFEGFTLLRDATEAR